jgi:hypothetical protein
MATTTNYGFEIPDDTDLVKDGALAMRDLGQDVDTTLATALNANDYAGLVLVKKQTIGTGVSSVVVNSAFSATYENYLIKISGGVASTANEFQIQLSGITTSVYYSNLLYNSYGFSTPLAAGTTAVAFQWCGNGSTSNIFSQVDITSPFLTKVKTYGSYYRGLGSALIAGQSTGFCDSTLSATGFTLTMNTGTITGGTIYVYGYGAS